MGNDNSTKVCDQGIVKFMNFTSGKKLSLMNVLHVPYLSITRNTWKTNDIT